MHDGGKKSIHDLLTIWSNYYAKNDSIGLQINFSWRSLQDCQQVIEQEVRMSPKFAPKQHKIWLATY